MKELPILFSSSMVRAILEGRKTQTRRVVKIQPLPPVNHWELDKEGWLVPRGINKAVEEQFISTWPWAIRCPYGQPGDRLWVRETWDFRSWGDGKVRIAYGAGGLQEERTPPPDWHPMIYNYERWRPSIHMPRWACRLVLEVASIRVEHIRDMPLGDVAREGMDGPFSYFDFRELWDSLYASRGDGWDANPWVWVVEFRRVASEVS